MFLRCTASDLVVVFSSVSIEVMVLSCLVLMVNPSRIVTKLFWENNTSTRLVTVDTMK